uniref:Uncharacterized protein n=1 Tax=Rodentolepis nana TaxID=102285 RepID=A0A0R3TFF8_RODNA
MNENSQRLGVGKKGTRQVGPKADSLECISFIVGVCTLKASKALALLASSDGGRGGKDGCVGTHSVSPLRHVTSEDATDTSESEGIHFHQFNITPVSRSLRNSLTIEVIIVIIYTVHEGIIGE